MFITRALVVGLMGAAAAIGLTEALRQIKHIEETRIQSGATMVPAIPIPAPAIPDRVFTNLTVREFFQFYQGGRNALQAARVVEPYVGLWIAVEGEIAILGPDNAGALVWLKQDETSVECRFSQAWVRDLSRSKVGDRLKAIGKIGANQPNGTLYLQECEILRHPSPH